MVSVGEAVALGADLYVPACWCMLGACLVCILHKPLASEIVKCRSDNTGYMWYRPFDDPAIWYVQSALQNSRIVPDVFDAVDFDNEIEMSVEFPTGFKVANGNDIPKDKASGTIAVSTDLGHTAGPLRCRRVTSYCRSQACNALHLSSAGAGSASGGGRGGQGDAYTHGQRS
jgi:hypothetical protein